MDKILLGIDIGTSACKVVAFRPDGSVVGQTNADYPVYYPQPGYVEQSADEWYAAVCKAIRALIAGGMNPAKVAGIGIDGQSWSAIAVDKDCNALCNTPIWMDTRAQDICDTLKAIPGMECRLFETSGNPLQPMYTLPKVLWYKKHTPEVYENAYKILQSNGYIGAKLTGAMTQDPSQGYGWNCYNMQEGCWDLALCEELGIRTDLLPEIKACHEVIGTLTENAAIETGLPVGVPVVAGGLDAACGTLGVGVLNPGETQEQGGQAGGMSICTSFAAAEPSLILGAHVIPERWLLQGGTVGGGGVMRWFEQEFGTDDRISGEEKGIGQLMAMNLFADEVPAGSDGLVFLPYMSGERSPIWNANAKGVYYGVDFTKTRAHFARASMEGVAYSLRHNLEVAAAAGATVDVLRAMGGAANSRTWMQIKADITGKKVVVPSADTATALGAAILAGVGTGIYSSFEQAVETTIKIQKEYTPNPENAAVYQKGYEIYRELYDNLKETMERE